MKKFNLRDSMIIPKTSLTKVVENYMEALIYTQDVLSLERVKNHVQNWIEDGYSYDINEVENEFKKGLKKFEDLINEMK